MESCWQYRSVILVIYLMGHDAELNEKKPPLVAQFTSFMSK